MTATWTAAGSPYLVTGDVTVPSGQTLTIQAGTEVRLKDDSSASGQDSTRAELVVAGTLSAQGTGTSPVRLTSAATTPQAGDWAEIRVTTGGTATFDSVVAEYSVAGLRVVAGTADVSLSTFRFNKASHVSVSDGPGILTVTDSTLSGASGAGGAREPAHGALLLGDGHVDLDGNTFVGNGIGISVGPDAADVEVRENTVDRNATGIKLESANNVEIFGNAVVRNGTGIETTLGASAPTGFSVERNDIEANTNYAWDHGGDPAHPHDLSAGGNWWGSSDPGAASLAIRDGDDEAGRGHVLYQPVLSNPSDTAPMVGPETVLDPAVGPSGTTNATSATFQFSSEPGATFECRLDSPGTPGGWAPCTSGQAYSGLMDGLHTFQVRAIDISGGWDVRPASRSWTVHTGASEAPQIVLPTPGGASVDAFAPVLRVQARRVQRLARSVGLTVSCRDEPCVAQATGYLTVPGGRSPRGARRFALRKASRSLDAGEARRLAPRLSKRARSAASGALRRGRRPTVRIMVVVTDAAGNAATRRLTIRLRR